MSLERTLAAGLRIEIARRIHPNLTLDVSLALGGEVGVVFGASGAGKTTLLRLIAGLATPDDGRVILDGRALFDSAKGLDVRLRDRQIGMIFQHDLLFPHLNVERNIGFGLNHWNKSQAAERVREVAALCGVDHLLGRAPETLSGGERQRVGLARSLAPRPRLLLCDEPVSALDLTSRNAMIDRLKAIQRAERIPILYVTHSPAEAISLGDTLFLLDQGRIAGQGAPLEVLSRFRSTLATHWEDVRNVFSGAVHVASEGQGACFVEIANGPTLHVSSTDIPPGQPVFVEVPASDIIVATGSPLGISAQNVLPGIVEKVVVHGMEAEIVVRTEGVRWIASVVGSTVDQLQLEPDREVFLIIKARSCRVTRRPSPA